MTCLILHLQETVKIFHKVSYVNTYLHFRQKRDISHWPTVVYCCPVLYSIEGQACFLKRRSIFFHFFVSYKRSETAWSNQGITVLKIVIWGCKSSVLWAEISLNDDAPVQFATQMTIYVTIITILMHLLTFFCRIIILLQICNVF